MAPPVAQLLVVESNPQRAAYMAKLAQGEGFAVATADDQRRALAHLRAPGADLLWAGPTFRSGTLGELLDLTRAAYPDLPKLVMVPRQQWAHGLSLLDQGAFDLMADDDDPRVHRAALRRGLADVRARATVREERGRLLGVQTKVVEVGPAVAEMLEGLTRTLRESVRQPDISLRAVEQVCVEALSRFLGGALVVVMAYERKAALLRPRTASTERPEHQVLQGRGFPFTPPPGLSWQEALTAISDNDVIGTAVKRTYAQRHVHLASLGPADEPYGVVAYFPDRATPPPPDELEILSHLAVHAGHCIQVARSFRTILRRGASSA